MESHLRHKLLTPLTIIRGNTDLVLKKGRLGKQEKKALSSVVCAVDKLAQEIRSL